VTVSTVKKSQARMLEACWRRNCCQVGPVRRGDGSRPSAMRMRLTVLEETRVSSLRISPAILV